MAAFAVGDMVEAATLIGDGRRVAQTKARGEDVFSQMTPAIAVRSVDGMWGPRNDGYKSWNATE
eukprot:15114310-Alexandrium_andersonii.AAC.1